VVEHSLGKGEVVGSIPTGSTTFFNGLEDCSENRTSGILTLPTGGARLPDRVYLAISAGRRVIEPMTSRGIALEMLVSRAPDKDDQKLLALMTSVSEWRCACDGSTAPCAPNTGQNSTWFGRSPARKSPARESPALQRSST
jgi:hypothetical protein